jgi:hypothetical protein
MEKSGLTVRSLRVRAEEFRARAADCPIPRFPELMHKGAAHLDEQAQLLEALLPVGTEILSRD